MRINKETLNIISVRFLEGQTIFSRAIASQGQLGTSEKEV
jgi:hypothetical protein